MVSLFSVSILFCHAFVQEELEPPAAVFVGPQVKQEAAWSNAEKVRVTFTVSHSASDVLIAWFLVCSLH